MYLITTLLHFRQKNIGVVTGRKDPIQLNVMSKYSVSNEDFNSAIIVPCEESLTRWHANAFPSLCCRKFYQTYFVLKTMNALAILAFGISYLLSFLLSGAHASALTTSIAANERLCFYADVDKAGEKIGVRVQSCFFIRSVLQYICTSYNSNWTPNLDSIDLCIKFTM